VSPRPRTAPATALASAGAGAASAPPAQRPPRGAAREAAVAAELALLGTEPLVSPEAVRRVLGVSRAQVYRLAGACNGIPCVKVGGSVRFRPADVRAYMEAHTVWPGPAQTTRAQRMLAWPSSPKK
jgi:excisionase family DNA binding protein